MLCCRVLDTLPVQETVPIGLIRRLLYVGWDASVSIARAHLERRINLGRALSNGHVYCWPAAPVMSSVACKERD